MKIIGREREKDILMQFLKSQRPELVAVYGNLGVGKTYLVKEFFNKHITCLPIKRDFTIGLRSKSILIR